MTLSNDDKEIIEYAKRFLNSRISSLNNDVKRCLIEVDDNSQRILGQLAPFPALLYCFSMIDMLAALYSGNTKGNPGEKSDNSRRYMRDCMKYNDHFTYLLQACQSPHTHSVTMEKTSHGPMMKEPKLNIYKLNTKKKKLDSMEKKLKHDGVFIIKISKLKEDIVQSVKREHDGFLAIIRSNKVVRGNFKKAVNEILYES